MRPRLTPLQRNASFIIELWEQSSFALPWFDWNEFASFSKYFRWHQILRDMMLAKCIQTAFNNDWVESCVDDKRYISTVSTLFDFDCREREILQHALVTLTFAYNLTHKSLLQFSLSNLFCNTDEGYGLMMNLLYHWVSSVFRNLHHIISSNVCVRKSYNYFHLWGDKRSSLNNWIQSYSESTLLIPLLDLYKHYCVVYNSHQIYHPSFSSSS